MTGKCLQFCGLLRHPRWRVSHVAPVQLPTEQTARPFTGECCGDLSGGLAMSFIVAAAGGDPVAALAVFGGVVAIALVLGWLFRAVPSVTLASRFSWAASRDARPANEYAPRRRKRRDTGATNRPPTAEELRDLKDGIKNWVPSNTVSGKRSAKNPPR